MRIAIFDGINETHVGSSLERALLARGHAVLNTGKIGRGFEFETDPVRLHGIERWIDVVSGFAPDVVFVFRPATLPRAQLSRLKRCGATLVAWFSDDPVLWDLSYRPVVNDYDLVLHCGSERVLAFYEKQLGRPTGPNFPFWTDDTAFPYSYGALPPESDVLFLGNVHDEVRRDRYFAMGDLASDIRIHGGVGIDFLGLGAGYLDSDEEVVDAGRRARLALNIPQFFRDHAGLPTWFPGLDDLGFFQYPSRVIQYAALGLPTMSLCPDADELRTFPELVPVRTIADVDETVSTLLAGDLQDLSARTRARFEAAFSAESRVAFLEHLLLHDDWRTLDVRDRADLFTHFAPSGTGRPPGPGAAEDVHPRLVPTDAGRAFETPPETDVVAVDDRPGPIMVVGTGWTRTTSQINVVVRALGALHHEVVAVNPFGMPAAYSKDGSKEYQRFFDPIKLERLGTTVPSTVVFVGGETGLSSKGAEFLRERGCTTVAVNVTAARLTLPLARLASRVDLLCTPSRELQAEFVRAGFENVRHLPRLVDAEARAVLAPLVKGDASRSVSVLGRRRSDLLAFPALSKDVTRLGAGEWYTSEHEGFSLTELAEPLTSPVVVAPPNAGVAGVHGEILPFVLSSGALLVVPRVVGRDLELPPDAVLQVREPRELERKLWRVWSEPGAYERRLEAAREYVDEHLAAEPRLAATLREAAHLHAAVAARPRPAMGVQPKPGPHQVWSTPVAAASGQATVLDLEIAPLEGPRPPDGVELAVFADDREVVRLPFPHRSESLRIEFPAGSRPAGIALRAMVVGAVGLYNWPHACGLAVRCSERPGATRVRRVAGASSSDARWSA